VFFKFKKCNVYIFVAEKTNDMTEQKLIEKCIRNDSKAQAMLYNHYAPRLFAVCKTYSKSAFDAEDILQEGFIKIFNNLIQFKWSGSFEGWMRRIMVTTALNFNKKQRAFCQEDEIDNAAEKNAEEPEPLAQQYFADLLNIINSLPKGYKKVLHLNTVQGYNHKDISELIGISTSTSKTQLMRAKRSMKQKLKKDYIL
jgi:RNA polymerase sigma factor, sigma-70 family